MTFEIDFLNFIGKLQTLCNVRSSVAGMWLHSTVLRRCKLPDSEENTS